jgi:hypothetical protein
LPCRCRHAVQHGGASPQWQFRRRASGFRAARPRFRRKRLAGPKAARHHGSIDNKENIMQQIFSHTPFYVWAILAFLVNRGIAASRDRTTTLRAAAIIPLVMAGLALQEIARRFGLTPASASAWLAGAAAGAAIAWQLGAQAVVAVDRAAGTVTQRGSWLPLVLMLGVFCGRYALAVAGAVAPAVLDDALFAMTASLVLGLLNGLLLGRVLRCLQAWGVAVQ